MTSIYRQTVGPNYVNNDFWSWPKDTLSFESWLNPSTPEIPVPFYNALQFTYVICISVNLELVVNLFVCFR